LDGTLDGLLAVLLDVLDDPLLQSLDNLHVAGGVGHQFSLGEKL
jgi:hypothetical protein